MTEVKTKTPEKQRFASFFKILNIEALHIRLILKKNKTIYLMLIIELTLLDFSLSTVVSSLFVDIYRKYRYLDREMGQDIAVLCIDSSIDDTLLMQIEYDGYIDLVNEIREINGITNAGFIINNWDTVKGGVSTEIRIYPAFILDSISQPLSEGRWLNTESGEQNPPECVIGGELTDVYSIGDIIQCSEGRKYKVIGKLTKQFYVLSTDTSSNKHYSISYFLDNKDNVIITTDKNQKASTTGSLLIEYDKSISLNELRVLLSSYGILFRLMICTITQNTIY